MKTVVYILSTNYAGSHYLSLLIGSHSKAAHLGEVKRLRKLRGERRKQFCTLCPDLDLCPLFKGISPQDLDQVYEKIFSNLGPETTTLIDSSKKPFWAGRFLKNQPHQIKVIHLIRDPRALIRRWMLTYKKKGQELSIRFRTARDFPRYAPSILFGKKEEVYLYRWIQQNKEIRQFLNQTQVDSHLVTYHDLSKNREQVLKPLMAWLNLKYEPSQLNTNQFEHHGTQKIEGWAKEKKPSDSIDLRWKDFLSEAAQNKIVEHKPTQQVLSNLGIRMLDDGLTLDMTIMNPTSK